MNLSVIGFAAMFIISDTQYVHNLLFANKDYSFSNSFLHYLSTYETGFNDEDRRKHMYLSAFLCVVMGCNPFQTFIQLSMGILYVEEFAEDGGIHKSSSFCNDIQGFGTNIDYSMAVITSLLALYVMLPTIYLVAGILVPQGKNEVPKLDALDREALPVRGEHEETNNCIGRILHGAKKMIVNVSKLVSILSIDLMASLHASTYMASIDRLLREGAHESDETEAVEPLNLLKTLNKSNTDNENGDYNINSRFILPSFFTLQRACRHDFYLFLCDVYIKCGGDSVYSSDKNSLTDTSCQNSLYWADIDYGFQHIALFIFAELCTSFSIGTMMTRRGLLVWREVCYKYILFFLICIGIWTEDAFMAYEPLYQRRSETCSTLYSAQNENREAYSLSLLSIIGPRAILLQILPSLSYLSLFVLCTASTPLVVLSKEMNQKLPPFFALDALSESIKREQCTSGSELTAESRGVMWTVYLNAIHIFWEESRAIMFIYNCCIFFLIILILYAPLDKIVAFAFLVVALHVMFIYIDHVVIPIGHFFRIKDDNFRLMGFFNSVAESEGEDEKGAMDFTQSHNYKMKVIEAKSSDFNNLETEDNNHEVSINYVDNVANAYVVNPIVGGQKETLDPSSTLTQSSPLHEKQEGYVDSLEMQDTIVNSGGGSGEDAVDDGRSSDIESHVMFDESGDEKLQDGCADGLDMQDTIVNDEEGREQDYLVALDESRDDRAQEMIVGGDPLVCIDFDPEDMPLPPSAPPPPPPALPFDDSLELAADVVIDPEDYIDPMMLDPMPRCASKETLSKVVALYDNKPEEAYELEFYAGDVIEVLEEDSEGWSKGLLKGIQGMFPTNYVEPYED